MNNVVTPSSLNADDLKKLKVGVDGIVECLENIRDQQDAIKDMITSLNADLGLDKKIIRKIAKTQFNNSFQEEQTISEDFQDLYVRMYT